MLTSIVKNDWAAKVVAADTPVLVKFGADWCGPCKAVEPILEQIDEDEDDNITVLSIDTDAAENDGLANAHNVRGVPTMILFDKGIELCRIVGSRTKPQICSVLDLHL